MSRHALRAAVVLFILALAVYAPIVLSGYSDLKQVNSASSLPEVARRYEAAARRIPWRPDLYELAGHAHYHAKEYTLADAAYQKAYRRGALSPDGWVAWGDVVYLNGDSQRAAELWEQGLEQPNPSENLYSRLARVYKEQEDYFKAAQYLQRYVSHHPNDAAAHYRLGLLLTLSDPNEAASELITASQLDPQFDPAVQTLRTALNLASLNESSSARLVVIGRGLGLVEEWELARAAFESAVEADEENAEAWAWLGEANQQTGLEGSVELDRAMSLDPNSSVVRGLRGLRFQRIGNDREALTEFQYAANLDPKNPAWLVSIGESYSKLGDLQLALEAYQYAAALAPDDAEYYRLLAGFCAQNNVNISDVGIPAAQKAVQLTPKDPRSLDTLGWLYLLAGRLDESERMLLLALERDSQFASAYYHLGLLHLQKDDQVTSFNYLIQARDLGSSEAQAVLNRYFP
jgi:tetratricopeptide (TPR) repeat protein